MKRLLAATLMGAFVVWLGSAPVSAAGSSPPPPPATPGCKWCTGPPPAPTPVPTLAPTVLAPQTQTVAVEISPIRVRRGQTTTVAVSATEHAKVTMVLRYSHGKPASFHSTIGSSRKLVKRWKVPKSAPTGKATVKIQVAGDGKPYNTTVAFTVTK